MSRTQHNKYPKVQYSTELIRVCPRNRSVVAPARVPKHRSERACPYNRSVVAPAGVPKHRSERACSRNRSAVAPTGVPKHRSERPLIHSSVLGSHTVICLSEPKRILITFCVHDILFFMFMFQFVFIFHIIFMFHEHNYTYCISYIFPITITYGISYTCTV